MKIELDINIPQVQMPAETSNYLPCAADVIVIVRQTLLVIIVINLAQVF